MIKIENVVTPSAEQWKAIILGCRNPMNSWEKSDSVIKDAVLIGEEIAPGVNALVSKPCEPYISIGKNDIGLMLKLAKAGTDHRKFMRMITVYVDITAPLYWWKETDQYKVGTVTNSCSTMHKIHDKEFTLEDFSHEHLLDIDNEHDINLLPWGNHVPLAVLRIIINALNECRDLYLETKDKTYWWQMIQILPSSYNQKRTVMLNYEVLANIYKSRKNHRLDEWRELCSWIETLPYHELITGSEEKNDLS